VHAHELELIVDLMYHGGLDFACVVRLRRRGEWGDSSPAHVVTKKTQAEIERLLDITDGKFAKRFVDENRDGGRKTMTKFRNRERGRRIEVVGAKLRAMMPFLNPVVISK